MTVRAGDVLEVESADGQEVIRAQVVHLSAWDFELELVGSGETRGSHIPALARPYRRFADADGVATEYGERRMREEMGAD
jgi:hypothetical protein